MEENERDVEGHGNIPQSNETVEREDPKDEDVEGQAITANANESAERE